MKRFFKKTAKQRQNQRSHKLIGSFFSSLSALLFLIGIWLILREYVFMPNTDYVAPPSRPSPSAVKTDQVTADKTIATSRPIFTPVSTPSPLPTPYDLIPIKIYFPTFEQVCEIQPVGKNETGAMDTVDSNIIAAWYKYGPSPGDRGNAIINGHKSKDGERGVFSKLPDMKIGDPVSIEMNDGSFTYWEVHSVNIYKLKEIPSSVMELRLNGEPEVTLISCTGRWDRKLGTSSKRAVVLLTKCID